MKIQFVSGVAQKNIDFTCYPVEENLVLPTSLPSDCTVEGSLFKGKIGNFLAFYNHKVILMGVSGEESWAYLGSRLQNFLETTISAKHIVVMIDQPNKAADLAFGMLLWSYRFDTYKTTLKKEDVPILESVTICTPSHQEAEKQFSELKNIASGVVFARDLMNEPCNVLTPEVFAQHTKELSSLGVKVTLLDEQIMKQKGMGCLLAVGQGSIHKPYMVIMEWQGGNAGDPPIALCGKGVTFDTGGISIKPSSKMDEMKFDMGGAAAVSGLMKAIALNKIQKNVVGVIGLVENMPDGGAYRPGDVLKSYSGQTVEVLNTDAEGRLVLADVLFYTQETYKPKHIIDLATLTGAIVTALGHEFAGLFSNDDRLASHLSEAGLKTGEKLWRLPLDKNYDKTIDSKIADVKNIGPGYAGSITAAQFLQRFVNKVSWAHIDIAGVALFDGGRESSLSRYAASGFGVKLLYTFLKDL